MRILLLALSLLASIAGTGGATAQTYPDRPVRIVVPIGPTGSYDIVGRLLADQLSKRLGQNFVVENRPGAGTVVGTQSVVQSPADGYTLLVGGLSNIVFNAGLYKSLSYDPLKDLVPVALVFNTSYTLVGNKGLPFATAKEMVAAAKKNPGKLTVANVGVGSGQHIVGLAFQKITGTKLLDVSYRGASLAYPDVLSGRVDLFFDSTPSALPHIKSGQLKGIGILTAKRNPQAPDVPTMTESGIAGLEIDSWIGLFAPAKTPPAAIARLQEAIAQALPELRPRIVTAGGEPMDVAPAALNGIIRADYDRWIGIIREAGIRLD
jgi:tripartite-type tricarboxylate transporter receptor subunit TctC